MTPIRARPSPIREQRFLRSSALVLLLVGIAPTQVGAQASPWAGCYDLEIGPWSRPLGHDTLSYAPPPRIRLDTLVGGGSSSVPVWHQVHPAPGSPPSIHEYTFWRPTGTDTVVIGWSTGLSGLSVRLSREGGLLRGRASTSTDVLPYEPHTADVIARPVACEAPIPPEHASWRRFPREVPLETGDTLALEEPLPREDLALEHYWNNIDWVRHRPTGLFSGATHARVGHMGGIVHRIEVFFDSKLGLDALETRLASALGPPTGRYDGSMSWSGREGHRFSLLRRTTTDGEEHLVILIQGRIGRPSPDAAGNRPAAPLSSPPNGRILPMLRLFSRLAVADFRSGLRTAAGCDALMRPKERSIAGT